MSFLGILNLNKPAGLSSRAAVDEVLWLTGKGVKAGHAGTLDPLASGVLVICLGAATRLIDHVQRMPKQYRGAFLLGRTSETEDTEGEITLLENPPVPARAAVEAAAAALVGTHPQRPPAYSALKVSGRRAYKLARRGERPVLQPRPVTIHSLSVVDYDYPRLLLDIRCGSGTYVRSLGRDLAERLGTGAVMSELVRTAVGDFRLDEACELRDLTQENLREHLLPPLKAVAGLAVVRLTDGQLPRIAQGRAIELSAAQQVVASATSDTGAGAEVAAVDSAGQLAALIVPRAAGLWGPTKVFQAT